MAETPSIGRYRAATYDWRGEAIARIAHGKKPDKEKQVIMRRLQKEVRRDHYAVLDEIRNRTPSGGFTAEELAECMVKDMFPRRGTPGNIVDRFSLSGEVKNVMSHWFYKGNLDSVFDHALGACVASQRSLLVLFPMSFIPSFYGGDWLDDSEGDVNVALFVATRPIRVDLLMQWPQPLILPPFLMSKSGRVLDI